MKYWRKDRGFTLERTKGSVAITDACWRGLLTAQEEGRIIQDDGSGRPVAVEPLSSIERLAAAVRQERDRRIGEVEWRIHRYQDEELLGLPCTDDRLALARYMQALRDVPSQKGFPTEVGWPALEEHHG